jgi:hypothetical protein
MNNVLFLKTKENDFEENASSMVRYKPKPIEELVKATRFTKKEIQLMYRGFKQVSYFNSISHFRIDED